jgi:type IV secretory pathway VirD2 relaxase
MTPTIAGLPIAAKGDRHHFRFIVAPEDAEQLSDLKAFTRDLMTQAERNLGTRLDWVGVDHWNTDNPRIHVIVHGKDEDGRDPVIARDYISHGMRARAAHLATLELGLRADFEIRLEAQVETDRWTKLDRMLAREAAHHDGIVGFAIGCAVRDAISRRRRREARRRYDRVGR